jgi:hypothetical protein
MAANTISTDLMFASLQMAAEAFLQSASTPLRRRFSPRRARDHHVFVRKPSRAAPARDQRSRLRAVSVSSLPQSSVGSATRLYGPICCAHDMERTREAIARRPYGK